MLISSSPDFDVLNQQRVVVVLSGNVVVNVFQSDAVFWWAAIFRRKAGGGWVLGAAGGWVGGWVGGGGGAGGRLAAEVEGRGGGGGRGQWMEWRHQLEPRLEMEELVARETWLAVLEFSTGSGVLARTTLDTVEPIASDDPSRWFTTSFESPGPVSATATTNPELVELRHLVHSQDTQINALQDQLQQNRASPEREEKPDLETTTMERAGRQKRDR